jgi:hypothetical protein
MLTFNQQIGLMDIPLAQGAGTLPVISPWILTSILYLGLTATLLMLAVRQMRRSR